MLNGTRLSLPPPTPINPFALPPGRFGQVSLKTSRAKLAPLALSGLTKDEFLHRQVKAITLAKAFCEATLEQRMGSDEKKMLGVLKTVQTEGIQPEFEIAALNGARRHGKIYASTSEIVEDELAGNLLERKFKSAARKEALDYLKVGRNTYRGTGWDYRLYGMYRSLADFGAVCKEYPVMSAGVIGAVAVLGGVFPFLGAASGIAIMGWTTLFTGLHEFQAAKNGKAMNAEKAEHYKASGENIAAFLLTASGMHGIINGTKLGASSWSAAANADRNASLFSRQAKGLKAAISKVDDEAVPQWASNLWGKLKGKPVTLAAAPFKGQSAKPVAKAPESNNGLIAWGNRLLFVVGLFDNVLLPFNAVADKLSGKPPEPK